jgi:NhaP-type Na+/H+ or K+/H+ antiporter
LVFGIEFFSWISLIPILFVTVLVILIRSLKKEKNGGTIASISLILSIITWVITLVTYAIHF